MPIALQDLRRATPGLIISEDRPCRACGYNLLGLKDDGACPECGHKVRAPKRAPQFTDQMSDAPLSWLIRFRRGGTLLCAGGWGITLGLIAWAICGHIACVLFALAMSLAWLAGTLIVTLPRPGLGLLVGTPALRAGRLDLGAQSDPAAEWKLWRTGARATQPAWTLALLGAALIQVNGWYTPLAVAPVGVLLLIGVAGWWPLMLHQSNLAYWACDTDLCTKLRHCSWASALGMGIGAAMFGLVGGLMGGVLGTKFAVLGLFAMTLVLLSWVGLGVFAMGYTLSALWNIMRLGHWSVVTHLNRDLRDERLRRRAARARDGHRAKMAR